MKKLNSEQHGIVDYMVVIFLMIAPTLFRLSDFMSTLTYILGAVHLALTVSTDFRFGLIKLIPLRVHGFIELVVAIVLIASPFALSSFTSRAIDEFFFCGFGVAVLLTWFISDYTVNNQAQVKGN